MTKILTLLITVMIITLASAKVNNSSPLPDDSKVTLKNSIAFHFIKNVKAIELELFVTRKIEVGPVIAGLERIQLVRDRVLTMCQKIQSQANDTAAKLELENKRAEGLAPTPTSSMHYINITGTITPHEARAKCRALGYQLPEILNSQQNVDLRELMQKHKIRAVHAGVEWSLLDSFYRFSVSGVPTWRAYHRRIYIYNGDKRLFMETSWPYLSARSNHFFAYTSEGLFTAFGIENVQTRGYQLYTNYWDKYHDINAFATEHLVCQTKWDGQLPSKAGLPAEWSYREYKLAHAPLAHTNKAKRAASPPAPKGPSLPVKVSVSVVSREKPAKTPLEELCYSVAEHMTETSERYIYRLTNALKQVDISIIGQLEDKELNKSIKKRETSSLNNTASALGTKPVKPSVASTFNSSVDEARYPRSLAKVIFKTGIKGIWGLLGFIDRVQTRRRIGKIEKVLNQQGQDLAALTSEVSSHSHTISQLTLVTRDLSLRLDTVQGKVAELESKLGLLSREVKTQQLLQLLDSLIGRADEAFTYAFITLENIIQYALVGQASAYLLPATELEKLQEEINKISSAVVDTAYERMRTTIVSDPLAPTSLTCFVNLHAMTRTTRELVQLIPIPWYQGPQALIPVLDYTTVLLDQQGGFYTVIDPSELNGCMEDKCITSNPEVSVTSPSCGIPQFFDRHINSCVNENVPSNGMFLKQLLYDGILYSIRQESNVQIFCTQQRISKVKKIQGSGIIQLPPGCTLAITDPTGATAKIQSSPLSQLYNAQSVDLLLKGPAEIFTQVPGTHSNVTSNLVRMINQHLEEMNQKLMITSGEIESHNFYVILLGTLLAITTVICILTALLLYRYSRRFRRRVRAMAEELKNGFSDITRDFIRLEQQAAQRARVDDRPPTVPPEPFIKTHKGQLVALPSPMLQRQEQSINKLRHGPSYQSLTKRLDDLELQLLLSDDNSSTVSHDYVFPMEANFNSRMMGHNSATSATSPPLPPKPMPLIAFKPSTNQADNCAIATKRPN